MSAEKIYDNKFVIIFVILLLSYTAINFLFLPHNHLLGHPIYMDDYNALAYKFSSVSWDMPRPVIYFLMPFFAYFGSAGFYLWVFFLTILCAALVFCFVRNFFSVALPKEWLIFYAIIVFSFPFIIDVTKFLGFIINLCSALFALFSLLALLKGYREDKSLFFILASLFYTLSLFTKEDFILPDILLVFYLFFFEKVSLSNANRQKIKLSLFLAYGVAAIIALLLFNKYMVKSVFTGMSVSSAIPYEIDTAFSSIYSVYMHYLTSNIYELVLFISVLLIFIACLFFANAEKKIKMFFLLAIIFSLIMPYSVLPNHTFYFYIYNWLPWESVVIVFGLFFLTMTWPKKIIRLLIGFLALVFILISYPHRSWRSHWYENKSEISKNITATLLHYRQQLNQEPYIGIMGALDVSPWLLSNGEYLRYNLGLKSKWKIFVDKSAPFFMIETTVGSTQEKPITVLSIKQTCDFPDMKYIYFNAHGNGKLSNNCRNFD